MTSEESIFLTPVGHVVSPLPNPARAPRQADEGGPPASILLEPAVRAAAADIGPGDRLVGLTWLHLADRSTLRVHPRDDPERALVGVFSTRSSDRPNPVGLHTVTVLRITGERIDVDALEA